MNVYGNYDIIAFRSCIQMFKVGCRLNSKLIVIFGSVSIGFYAVINI